MDRSALSQRRSSVSMNIEAPQVPSMHGRDTQSEPQESLHMSEKGTTELNSLWPSHILCVALH